MKVFILLATFMWNGQLMVMDAAYVRTEQACHLIARYLNEHNMEQPVPEAIEYSCLVETDV